MSPNEGEGGNAERKRAKKESQQLKDWMACVVVKVTQNGRHDCWDVSAYLIGSPSQNEGPPPPMGWFFVNVVGGGAQGRGGQGRMEFKHSDAKHILRWTVKMLSNWQIHRTHHNGW